MNSLDQRPATASSGRRTVRWMRWTLVCAIVAIAAMIGWGYTQAVRDPVVRTAIVSSADFTSARLVRVLLMSDIHVQGPDMPPSRLARIVDQANSLRPDVIILTGDFVGSSPLRTASYDVPHALQPLASLRAPFGVFAVLGNNDRDLRGQIRAQLTSDGVQIIQNRAVQVGPIALGGVATVYGRNSVRRLMRLRGMKVLVSHSPDGFAIIPSGVDLMLAGHTHCGQIVLPILGALFTGSRYGSRYRCGLITAGRKVLIVTAGLGTSHIPIRFGAPPDMWLITIDSK